MQCKKQRKKMLNFLHFFALCKIYQKYLLFLKALQTELYALPKNANQCANIFTSLKITQFHFCGNILGAKNTAYIFSSIASIYNISITYKIASTWDIGVEWSVEWSGVEWSFEWSVEWSVEWSLEQSKECGVELNRVWSGVWSDECSVQCSVEWSVELSVELSVEWSWEWSVNWSVICGVWSGVWS